MNQEHGKTLRPAPEKQEPDRAVKRAFGVEPAQRLYDLRLVRYKALAETIVKYLESGSASNGAGNVFLLDIGVGEGRCLAYLAAQGNVDCIHFHGVDRNEKRMKAIHSPERWTLARADIEDGLPYGTAQFDICICEQVLEHLKNPDRVIQEAARVLKPSGLLVAGVPTFPPIGSHVRALAGSLLYRHFGILRKHRQTFDRRRLERMIEKRGEFVITSVRGFRVVSGGPLGALEDCQWWYRFNRMVGRMVPALCVEVQVIARRAPVS